MRSSYTGFGYSSLSNDVEDIAAVVTYLRELGKEKVVLLGSSTGMETLEDVPSGTR
jgi:pimeloyl-ACP methyl ester carboxylesterase